uniref:Uncharacterized protein n=1 Tax=Arundo donax TaxID=35708 RepID=A0A0A8Y340_ARUDO
MNPQGVQPSTLVVGVGDIQLAVEGDSKPTMAALNSYPSPVPARTPRPLRRIWFMYRCPPPPLLNLRARMEPPRLQIPPLRRELPLVAPMSPGRGWSGGICLDGLGRRPARGA